VNSQITYIGGTLVVIFRNIVYGIINYTMIELYVVVTLLGLGYLVNQKKDNVIRTPILKPPIAPSQQTPYKSNFLDHAKAIERKSANISYAKSLRDPQQSKVVNRERDVRDASVMSHLAGIEIPNKEFSHNNMMPFFRGSIKQNIEADGNKTRLEMFGNLYNDDVHKRKQERPPLFDMQKDISYIAGAPVSTQVWRDRIEAPKMKNNVLPFEQVRVGPGINQGYEGGPTGGYQQLDIQDVVRPKTVDDLRVASKPKGAYEGRIVDGRKGERRGIIGQVAKNRAETTTSMTHDNLFKTTGAFLRETQHPKYEAKYTSRLDTTSAYGGGAYANRAYTARSQIRDPFKTQLEGFELCHPILKDRGRGADHDYGKASILVYENERDITSVQTHEGNITTLVKALMAPLEDIMKTSKKELTVDHPRHYGELSAQIPKKQTVRDPNDVMRTTIKETTIHDTENMNLKGHMKVPVYDPNVVARTTVRETMTVDAPMLNLQGGAKKAVAYDPSSIARTTVKETTIHDADVLNISTGAFKGVVKDPNDVTRTTIKETTLHDAIPTNVRGLERRGLANDASDIDIIARTTIRQTVDPMDVDLNLQSIRKVSVAYDPEDRARTTHKETLVDNMRDGNVDGLQKRNASYEDESYDMKATQKEVFSDLDYYGVANKENANGYQVANIEAKQTQKEETSNHEHYGGLADQTQHVQMSYEDMYNATINELRENTLVRREPTQTSVKLATGADHVRLDVRKVECDQVAARMTANRDHIINTPTEIEPSAITRTKQNYDIDERMDVDILKPFLENPYTKSLNSFA
jgi:hypothetical protein